ncbi:MAG: phospholipid carrier-dependent glycosyltransferase [Actinomycetota bacterium]
MARRRPINDHSDYNNPAGDSPPLAVPDPTGDSPPLAVPDPTGDTPPVIMPDPEDEPVPIAASRFARRPRSDTAPRQPVEFRWARRDWVIIVLLVALAAGLRFPRLDQPSKVVFDETYYAKDACLYLGRSPESCRVDQSTEQSYVHPPLGKWLIALGIAGFGYNSLGWRFSAAVVGTLLVVLVFVMSRKLFLNRWAAGAAGFLAATDFLLIVQSRIAMLDIFLAFFVIAGFTLLCFDRARVLDLRAATGSPARIKYTPRRASWLDDSEAAAAPDEKVILDGPPPKKARRRGMWLRYAAGTCFGLAVAVKWSAVWALLAGFLMACFWSSGLLRSLSGRKLPDNPTSWLRELGGTLAALVLVPSLVYLAVYVPYYVDRAGDECAYTVPPERDHRLFGEGFLGLHAGKCVEGVAGAALSFADLQDRMLDYHLNLTAKHSYQSRAWTWPLVLRPVAYFYETPGGKSKHILGFGNPITWWAALGGAVWLAARGLRKWAPERVVLAAWGAQYLPWLTVSRPLFFFYMTPVVAFMMMGLAGMLAWARNSSKVMRRLVYAYLLVGVVLATFYFYPVFAAVGLQPDLWQSRMWIKAFDCGRYRCGWI